MGEKGGTNQLGELFKGKEKGGEDGADAVTGVSGMSRGAHSCA